MFLRNNRMQYTVRVDQPDADFAKLLLEQFGGPNGELAAAMRYFTQGWAAMDPQRRTMLLDIATEELSHLEMVAQTLGLLLKGSPSELVDQVEGGYLGDMLDGQHDGYMEMSLALHSSEVALGGGGPRLTDSEGNPWTAAYIDTIGQPVADLHSDIAAEARAKIVYERLINACQDPGVRDTLTFLMTREIAHQKAFEAALASITDRFPPGQLDGDQRIGHVYVADSDYPTGDTTGFEFVESNIDWGFELVDDPVAASDGVSDH
jgi:Mn-containing catalase